MDKVFFRILLSDKCESGRISSDENTFTYYALDVNDKISAALCINKRLCTMCGLCTEIAENVFAYDSANNAVKILGLSGNPHDVIQTAIDACPLEAISWELIE